MSSHRWPRRLSVSSVSCWTSAWCRLVLVISTVVLARRASRSSRAARLLSRRARLSSRSASLVCRSLWTSSSSPWRPRTTVRSSETCADTRSSSCCSAARAASPLVRLSLACSSMPVSSSRSARRAAISFRSSASCLRVPATLSRRFCSRCCCRTSPLRFCCTSLSRSRRAWCRNSAFSLVCSKTSILAVNADSCCRNCCLLSHSSASRLVTSASRASTASSRSASLWIRWLTACSTLTSRERSRPNVEEAAQTHTLALDL
mmetsp:Transcript_55394/g.124791  ORF Transcript_55394/g.124791 Transcript_55394/m.124791 type:complete len:261 (+) Transcript_55394:272-1054(+)